MNGIACDVLVIGASGLLGRALTDRLSGRNVVLTHHTRPLDSGSRPYSLLEDDPQDLIPTLSPGVVFMTFRADPDAPEQDVQDAFRGLATTCGSTRVVLASTDAVLEGSCGGYDESADPRPATPHGHRYLGFEQTLRRVCPNACAIRFSYLYGYSDGTLDRRLAKTRQLLREGKTVPLFDDMFKSPLEVNHAAAVMETVAGLNHNGILHAGGRRMSVYEFQQQAMRTLGERHQGLTPPPPPPPQRECRKTGACSVTLPSIRRFFSN